MEISTQEAAARLGVTAPTVRSLIERGTLAARRQQRGGSRFRWLVDDGDVARLRDQLRSRPSRLKPDLADLERQIAELREIVERMMASGAGAPAVTEERDSLRGEVVQLREAILHLRLAAERQAEADDARAQVVRHLLAVASEGERADARRRDAVAAYEEALAQFSRPSHPGEM